MSELLMTFEVVPVPKPRMTQRDKWKKRPIVLAYRAYKDALLIAARTFDLPFCGVHITFHMPMPKSWSQKKRELMRGQAHQSRRADVDNLHKGLLDALLEEDAGVWDHRITKLWADRGSITIRSM